MLKKLQITNYILIEELDIEFSEGLTIITGETGAGKSILLGALALILGQRADVGALLNKKKKCILEGSFDIGNYALDAFFETHELDKEEITSLRREITPEGKSRAFINDTPVNLNVLRELADTLVDIHSQHETLTLSNSRFQLSVVDAFAKHQSLLNSYKSGFQQYSHKKKELETLKEEERKSKADLDYFQFQFNELEEAGLKEGEQILLEGELLTLTHAEEIRQHLSNSYNLLSGSDDNLIRHLTNASGYFTALVKIDAKYNELLERIKSAIIELKDISAEAERFEQQVSADPNRMEHINERLNVIYKLEQKHYVKTVEELFALREQFGEKLAGIGSLESTIEKTEKEVLQLFNQLMKEAKEISGNRSKAIPKIEKVIKELTNELVMPNAVLKVDMTTASEEEIGIDGLDKVVFLFTANKGTTLKELSKVASGGELSRLMLAIKSVLANLAAMPTIIFDEIDTGISGEVASKVGTIMQQIAKKHQVIAITHLPQIAGKGQEHLLVYKTVSGSTTRTGIRPLDPDERVNEIARMLSGEKLTTAALEHAKGLLDI